MSKSLDIGGAVTLTSGHTAYNPCDVYSIGYPWAVGNPDLNGATAVYVELVTAKYLTGSAFALINKDGAEVNNNGWTNSGGTVQFTIRKTAANTSNFGRNSAGTPSPVRNTRDSVTWSGCLCGTVAWSTHALRPPSITVGPHPSEELGASVFINAATDDGGATITAYQLYYSTNGGSSWVAVGSPGPFGQRLVTGLTEGVSYLFAAATLNARGTSQRRNAAAAYVPESPANINRRGASAFEKRSIERYGGATFARAEMKRWNGTSWVDTK